MVGRRGISKGCMRCRQRKKGCDLKRPACGQCLQRGSTCPGYGSGMTFVHDSRSLSSNTTSATRDLIRSLSRVSTPPSFIQSATQIGLSDHFWYIYLPRRFASLGSQQGGLDDFFQAVEHLSSDEVVSKHAFWALSFLIIGCEVSNSELLLQGSRMYGQALKELRGAIEDVRNESLTSSAEMAMTCNLLALYEIFDDPSQTRFGFFTHSQGLARLVQLRGPSGFRSGVAWAAFQGVRAAIIISAIQRRRATFLSSDEWCTSPWQLQAKPPYQRAFDIATHIPGLLEMFDQMQRITSDEDKYIRSLQLLEYCQTIDRALQALYQELPSLFGLESPTELWHTKERSNANSPFPVEVYFDDLPHGQALILYWATAVFAYSTMQKLHQHLTSTSDMETDATLSLAYTGLLPHPDPYDAAARIVQSIPYFLQPTVGLLMRKIFVFPLAAAYAYFASFPARSTIAHSPTNTSESPRSTGGVTIESYDLAGVNVSPMAPEAAYIDNGIIQTYLETTANIMHIYGLQINVFCAPASPKSRPFGKI